MHVLLLSHEFVVELTSCVLPAVSAENGYFFVWIAACIVNTAYAYTWDIKMDWSLLQKGAKYPFLRNKITYSPKVRRNSIAISN